MILIFFLLKLGDSLYIRNHGDAMGYHLYAPLMWARYGWDYISGFQVMQYQSGLWESILTVLFKFWSQEDLEQRKWTHIFFQVISCSVGFLLIPWLLWTKTRLTFMGRWVLLWVYFGAETLLWSSQFAKNDSIAMGLFVWGFLRPARSWSQILLLALAVGVKPTYLYAAFVLAVLAFDRRHLGEFFRQGLILLGPLPTWIRSYLNAGNPFFPLPSARGLQTSDWQRQYFEMFVGGGFGWDYLLKFSVFLRAPLMGVVFFTAVAVLFFRWSKKADLQVARSQVVIFLLPVFYFFLTGPELEPRTYAGIFVACMIVAIQSLQSSFQFRPVAIGMLALVGGLATSKLDPSSWNRFRVSGPKSYQDQTNWGKSVMAVNDITTPSDLVLTQLSNEGWYLKAPLLTVNEHKRREELLSKVPVLQDIYVFLVVHHQKCDWTGYADHFVDTLILNADRIRLAAGQTLVYEVDINCGVKL